MYFIFDTIHLDKEILSLNRDWDVKSFVFHLIWMNLFMNFFFDAKLRKMKCIAPIPLNSNSYIKGKKLDNDDDDNSQNNINKTHIHTERDTHSYTYAENTVWAPFCHTFCERIKINFVNVDRIHGNWLLFSFCCLHVYNLK